MSSRVTRPHGSSIPPAPGNSGATVTPVAVDVMIDAEVCLSELFVVDADEPGGTTGDDAEELLLLAPHAASDASSATDASAMPT